MISTEDKKRFINIIRGFAVFLMLWGHSIQCCSSNQFDFFETPVFKFIYSFHMPLFMMISGYLFYSSAQKRTASDLFVYKIKSLLYPIFMCTAFNYLLTYGILNAFSLQFVTLRKGYPIYDLWFLWSVLIASAVLTLAVKVSNNRLVQFVLIACGIIVPFLLPEYDLNVYMYPFFAIGYLFARSEKRLIKYINFFGIFSIIAFIVMLFFFKTDHYIYTTGILLSGDIKKSISIDLFRWGIGFFGSAGFIWLWIFLLRRIKSKAIIFKYFEKLGADSLAFYSLSIPLQSFWLTRLAEKIVSSFSLDLNKITLFFNILLAPVISILISLIVMLFIRLLRKVRVFKFIFGKE